MTKHFLHLAFALATLLSTLATTQAGISVSYQSGGNGCAPPPPWYTYWPVSAYHPPQIRPAFPFWPTPQQQVGMFPGWPRTDHHGPVAEPRPLFSPEVQRAVDVQPVFGPSR